MWPPALLHLLLCPHSDAHHGQQHIKATGSFQQLSAIVLCSKCELGSLIMQDNRNHFTHLFKHFFFSKKTLHVTFLSVKS